MAHRLAWFYVTGEWPVEIDHRDRQRGNNVFSNLRSATSSLNKANTVPRGSLGFKGVYRNYKGFSARICVEGTTHYLGIFRTVAEAASVYQAAAEKHFGEFAFRHPEVA
jgi:hypothetical protein